MKSQDTLQVPDTAKLPQWVSKYMGFVGWNVAESQMKKFEITICSTDTVALVKAFAVAALADACDGVVRGAPATLERYRLVLWNQVVSDQTGKEFYGAMAVSCTHTHRGVALNGFVVFVVSYRSMRYIHLTFYTCT